MSDQKKIYSPEEITAKVQANKRIMLELQKMGDPRGSPEMIEKVLQVTRMVLTNHNAKVKGEWN